MKKLFAIVMMVALAITLAQLKAANSAAPSGTARGGGYIDSGCDPGNAIATFGFSYSGDEVSAKSQFGTLFYSDHGCPTDSPLRNLRAEIIASFCVSGPNSVNFMAITDEGDTVYVFAKDNSGTGEPDQFQIVTNPSEVNCNGSFQPVLAGKITVGKK